MGYDAAHEESRDKTAAIASFCGTAAGRCWPYLIARFEALAINITYAGECFSMPTRHQLGLSPVRRHRARIDGAAAVAERDAAAGTGATYAKSTALR